MKRVDIISQIPKAALSHVNVAGAGVLANMIEVVRSLTKELESVPDRAEPTAYLAGHLKRLEGQAAAFLGAADVLAKICPVFDQAHRAWAVAQERYDLGSDDAAEALALRDDVEVRAQRRRRLEREFLAAKQACGELPQSGIMAFHQAMDRAQRVLARMSFACCMKAMGDVTGRGTIDQDLWEKWVALGLDDTRWEPLALEREIAHSRAAKENHVKHHGHQWRTNDTPFSEEKDLRAMYAELVTTRRGRKAAAIARAKGALAQAEAAQ